MKTTLESTGSCTHSGATVSYVGSFCVVEAPKGYHYRVVRDKAILVRNPKRREVSGE
jgi:hypothetical protein